MTIENMPLAEFLAMQKPKRKNKKPEGNIKKTIMAWLQAHNIPAWNNATGAYKMGDSYIRYGAIGSADIMAILPPSGRSVHIEVKSATGTQKPAQKRWQAMVERAGGIYILARGIEDVTILL